MKTKQLAHIGLVGIISALTPACSSDASTKPEAKVYKGSSLTRVEREVEQSQFYQSVLDDIRRADGSTRTSFVTNIGSNVDYHVLMDGTIDWQEYEKSPFAQKLQRHYGKTVFKKEWDEFNSAFYEFNAHLEELNNTPQEDPQWLGMARRIPDMQMYVVKEALEVLHMIATVNEVTMERATDRRGENRYLPYY